MRRRLRLLALALPLAACAPSRPTLSTLGMGTEAVKAVPCPSLHDIFYHAPRDADAAKAWAVGRFEDNGNGYDTPSTVDQILQQNAAIEAVCGVPK